MDLRKVVQMWEDPAFKNTIDREMRQAITQEAFNLLFTVDGDFLCGADPYYTDCTLEDIGSDTQRGTVVQITVCWFMFGDNGSLREWLQTSLTNLLATGNFNAKSDLMRTHFGKEMDRITRQQYRAIYAWK